MGRWQSTQERSQGFWRCLSYPTISFKAYDMIPTSFAWLYEDLWHHRWLQLDERTFLKAKVLAVCATAVQSHILGPTKLLRLNTWNYQWNLMCFWLKHLSKLSNIFEILSHILTRYEEKGHCESQKTKTSGAVFLNWYQMISKVSEIEFHFQVSELEQHILWAFGSAWSSWEFSMKLGHVQFLGFSRSTEKKHTHWDCNLYIIYRIRLQQQCITNVLYFCISSEYTFYILYWSHV